MLKRKRITLVYFNAGGGHRAAARALQAVIAQQRRPWDVTAVNLFEAIDPTGRWRRALGADPEDFYNRRLQLGWTIGLSQELRILQGLIRLAHGTLVRALQQHWLQTEPDLVLSLIPNFNRALHDSLASALPGIPFATLLTDIADLPPRFWIEPGLKQHLIVGSERALAQARAAGHADERISLSSGMVLHPDFHAVTDLDRAVAQRQLGLDPQRPTGVVMFGGQGSMQMLRIARALHDQQLILFCGHNQKLAERLRRLPSTARHVVLGFTEQVAAHMRLADYFIGKPGPGCLSEALQCGLPVLTFEGLGTMPQERYNAQWIREQGLGRVLRSVAHVRDGTLALIQELDIHREVVARLDNRAVFELPEILAGLLQAAAVPQAQPCWRTPTTASSLHPSLQVNP